MQEYLMETSMGLSDIYISKLGSPMDVIPGLAYHASMKQN
jgi:hypothetical protein